jgi:hypothetical protein
MAVSENGICRSQTEDLAAFGAFYADGRGRGRFFVGGAAVPVTTIVLGADYNPGDHAIIARGRAHCFRAALCRYAIRSAPGRNRSHILRLECASIWNLRVRSGIYLRSHARRLGCISLRRYDCGDCATDSACGHGQCVASCFSSFRGSLDRNCGRLDIRVGVAGE